MCDPVSGMCGEDATTGSPRTVYSAKNEEQYNRWWNAHAALNDSVVAFENDKNNNHNHHNHTNKPTLILMGDSITESWIGTNMGLPTERAVGIPQVLQEQLNPLYRTLVLAIGGDQTQHLLYRLQHGELPSSITQQNNNSYENNDNNNNITAAFVVVLIGTNNLGAGMLPDPTADGIQAVLEYLLEETTAKIVVQSLLPRGDDFRTAAICPPRCNPKTGKPYQSFQPAVNIVNTKLRDKIYPELKAMYPEQNRLVLMDCSAPFWDAANDNVNMTLMPDALHPNAQGHAILATCILNCIQHGDCTATG